MNLVSGGILTGERVFKYLLPIFCATIRAIEKRLKMLSTALWVTALALESALLLRAFQANFLKQYRFFYLYLGWVLISDLSLIPFYYLWPKVYGYAYWCSQFFSVVVGCSMVWEAYKVALARYPGAARMARNVLPFMFILATTRILVKAWNSPNWIPGRTTLETEGLTLRDYLGDSFQRSWQYIQPVCYLLVLSVWCMTLWSYAPIPEPTTEPRLEADYESLVAATKRKVQSARSYLLKAMRS